MFVLIVGNWYTEEEINAIPSYPHQENLIIVDDFDDLDSDLTERLQRLVCDSECNLETIGNDRKGPSFNLQGRGGGYGVFLSN